MEYWIIKWNFIGKFFYLSQGLFASKRDRLQLSKGTFRIHSRCFWQQRSSPTIHQTHFNLPAFHSQQHYFLYTRWRTYLWLVKSYRHRWEKKYITRLYASDDFMKNRKDVAGKQEEQMTFYTQFNTSLKRLKQCSHGVDWLQNGRRYGLANLLKRKSENIHYIHHRLYHESYDKWK